MGDSMKYEYIRELFITSIITLSGWYCDTNIVAYIMTLLVIMLGSIAIFISEEYLTIEPLPWYIYITKHALMVAYIVGIYHSGQIFLGMVTTLIYAVVLTRLYLLRKKYNKDKRNVNTKSG